MTLKRFTPNFIGNMNIIVPSIGYKLDVKLKIHINSRRTIYIDQAEKGGIVPRRGNL